MGGSISSIIFTTAPGSAGHQSFESRRTSRASRASTSNSLSIGSMPPMPSMPEQAAMGLAAVPCGLGVQGPARPRNRAGLGRARHHNAHHGIKNEPTTTITR